MNWGFRMDDKMTNPHQSDDALLQGFFDAARAPAPDAVPTDDFMARMLNDAFDVQDAKAPVVQPAARRPWYAALMDAVGGWPSLAGMAVAAVAGVWIGVVGPSALADFALTGTGEYDSAALASDYGLASGFETLLGGS